MKPHARFVIATAIALALAAGSIAAAPQEARAVTTSYMWTQFEALRTKVASVIAVNGRQTTSIASLTTRVRGIETTTAAMSNRVGNLESSTTAILGSVNSLSGALAGLPGRMETVEASHAVLARRVTTLESNGSQSDFWPATEVSVNPVVHADWDWDAANVGCFVALTVDATDTASGVKHTSITVPVLGRVTVGDDVFVGHGNEVRLDHTPTTLPSGTPITVETWVEAFGQRIHETRTITDWAWVP